VTGAGAVREFFYIFFWKPSRPPVTRWDSASTSTGSLAH
jgi:hypothetical protein